MRVGKEVQAPKKIKHVGITFPHLPPTTKVYGAVWIAEALIDQTGKVVEVWPLREIRTDPPTPALTEAAVNAIRQWVFEPPLMKKKPVPVCMTVTANIDV